MAMMVMMRKKGGGKLFSSSFGLIYCLTSEISVPRWPVWSCSR
jgi:hypothetical protein